jgi:hypothetical protein
MLLFSSCGARGDGVRLEMFIWWIMEGTSQGLTLDNPPDSGLFLRIPKQNLLTWMKKLNHQALYSEIN